MSLPTEGDGPEELLRVRTAVERSSQVEGPPQEARGVRALLRIAKEIGDGGSYGETVVAVCRLTREALAADRATLLRWDAAARQLATTAHDGTSPAEVEAWADRRHAVALDPVALPEPYRQAQRDGRLIVAPLAHAGRIYGLLAVQRAATAAGFDAAQIALLEGVARQTGMALDNLRLFEAEGHAAALAATLLEVARELNAAADPSLLLARLGARAVELARATAAAIALRVVGERTYRVEAVHGVPAEALVGLEWAPADAPQAGAAGFPLPVEWATRLARATGTDAGTTSTLGVPLERGGETLGVLMLLWSRGETPSAAQLALARGLADQGAVALQNVRLVDDIREASRLKSEFVSTMSHELRTPLNVMMGYTDLLLDGAFGELDAEKRGVLGRMQRSTRELLDLVTATLDLSRLEAGKSRVTIERVALPDLLAQVEAEVTPLLEGREVKLVWRPAADLPVLETDPAKLRIVLRNLIGNGIKFTGRGTVTVEAERVEQGVLFTVTDTGEGIRAEDMRVIFEMFRQVESATTRRHGGVGLGLYIVKRLLAELQGEIDVESEVGVGSRFWVRVPFRIELC